MTKSKFTGIIIIFIVLFATGCNHHIDYSNYKNEYGYSAYISDRNSGDETSFCKTQTSLEKSEKAVSFYENNNRQFNDFIITNYEDGICINRVLNPAWWDGKIPETIDGKPVVKLGCYMNEQGEVVPFVNINNDSSTGLSVFLPKTVKYIDEKCFSTKIEYNVDKDNPYYFSNYDEPVDDENIDEEGLYAINNKGEKIFVYVYGLLP